MIRKIVLTAIAVAAFSVCALAGDGSDTVGKGKLLPELRYGYSVSSWRTNDYYPFSNWDSEAHYYYAQFTFGVLDNLDLFVRVGGQTLRMDSEYDEYLFFPPTSFTMRQDLETDCASMFMWGVGARETIYRADNGFYLGAGVLFTHSISDKYSMTDHVVTDWDDPSLPDDYTKLGFDDMLHTNIYRLTGDLHAGWHFKNIGMTPYIGAECTWGRIIMSIDGDEDVVYELEHPWTMYAGLEYYLNDRLYLNVEVRTDFADGWGVETGIGYLFDLCKKPEPAPEPGPAPVIEPKLEPMSSK